MLIKNKKIIFAFKLNLLLLSTFFIGTNVQAANLTSGNINSCGTINAAGTYILQNDIASDGTCIYVNANGVTVDLNGHTLTYDNAPPIMIANGSFESTNMGDWDFSGAPSATVAQGAYLARTLYEGDKALEIPAPLTQDQSIVTAASYNLTGGVSYSASVMMWEPYDITNTSNSDIHMVLEILDAADNSVLASRDLRSLQAQFTSRGFQYVRAIYTPASDLAVKIRLTVIGARTVTNVGQAPYGAFYFDDVRLQQTNHAGIKFGMTSPEGTVWARQGTVTSTGTKGKVVQGQSHGDFSDAIKMAGILASDLNSYKVDNVEITVAGNSSHAIWATQAANGTISNNLIHGNTDTIELRDHYDGALVYVSRADSATGVAGKIFNNTITNGIQTGIYVAGSPSATMLTEIYNNTISLQSKYTNDFGIVGGYGSYAANVHDNTIDCVETNSCRGIFIHGNSGIIKDNIISVQYKKNNQEYGLEYGGCGGAAYGIQVDMGSDNALTQGNTVNAYADGCEAAAFRFYASPAGSITSNVVTANVFNALSAGTSIASTVRILETYASDLNFSNNTLITNSNFLYLDGNNTTSSSRSLTLDSNTFQLAYPKSSLYYPLLDKAYLNCSADVPKNVSLLNNTYADTFVREDLQNALFNNVRNSYNSDDCPDAALQTISQNSNVSAFSLADFVVLVTNWFKTQLVSDLNSDNAVNAKDLGMMMSKWN